MNAKLPTLRFAAADRIAVPKNSYKYKNGFFCIFYKFSIKIIYNKESIYNHNKGVLGFWGFGVFILLRKVKKFHTKVVRSRVVLTMFSLA